MKRSHPRSVSVAHCSYPTIPVLSKVKAAFNCHQRCQICRLEVQRIAQVSLKCYLVANLLPINVPVKRKTDASNALCIHARLLTDINPLHSCRGSVDIEQ